MADVRLEFIMGRRLPCNNTLRDTLLNELFRGVTYDAIHAWGGRIAGDPSFPKMVPSKNSVKTNYNHSRSS